MSVILDASAVLALLLDEPGKDVVAAHAKKGRLLSVNLSEILTRVIDTGGDPVGVHRLFDQLEIDIVAFDEALAIEAALLRKSTKAIGASLGDRACLALARTSGLPVLTADQDWSKLDLGLDIRQIR